MAKSEPMIDIVVPLYNEERVLANSVDTIIGALSSSSFSYPYRIILTNNASTDGSGEVCDSLAQKYPDVVQALHLDRKGKGLAVHTAWEASDASILAFMDADLSSDLSYFEELIEHVASGRSHMAIGNRLGDGSIIISRKRIRGLASRLYNLFARLFLGTPFDDHQCGFKAIRAESYRSIAPRMQERGFLFDTELLARAHRLGWPVTSVDIVWREGEDSKVSLFRDSVRMFADIIRLRRRLSAEKI